MKNSRILLIVLLASAAGFLSSCESTTNPVDTKIAYTDSTLFVLSEGSLGSNNAQLDAYSLKTATLSSNIINPLGDLGNDIQLFGKKMYIVLENSNKILAVNPDSVEERTSIQFPGNVTPYKMARVSSDEVWVTEFKNKQIAVLNISSNTLTSAINLDTAQQDIGILDGKAFVCTNGNKLAVIDIATKQLISNKYIGDSPSQVLIDISHNAVVVLVYGFFGVSTPKILWVDPVSFNITDSISISSTDFITQLIPAGKYAYLTYGDRTDRLDLATHQISAFLTKPYYKGYYDPVTQDLFLSDAKDFSSPGVVDVYDAGTGNMKMSINSGIIPGSFIIYRR